MENQTVTQFQQIIHSCKTLFVNKTKDYGTAWRILRLSSITDQIFIKARRIRSIQEKGIQLVGDPIQDEFIGIINYSIIALIQLRLSDSDELELSSDWVENLYQEEADATLALLQNKNHDYGEVWRDMRVSSITDIILMKILRVKQIEDNKGHTIVSEGIDANYRDMLNYAVFALILLNENE